MRDTSSIPSGRVLAASSRISHLKPSWTPSTSKPSLIASIVAAEITELIPGAGPPPTKIANLPGDDIVNAPERSNFLLWEGRLYSSLMNLTRLAGEQI